MVRLLSSLLVLTALGCGSPPPTAAPAPVASTAPATSSSAPPGTSEPRVASGTMRSAWPFTRTSRALYADIGGLLATATFGHLAALAPQLAAGHMSGPQKRCLDEVLPAVRELALGAEGNDAPLLLVRIDPAATDALGACVEANDGHPIEVGGNTARAWDLAGAMVALTSSGLVAMGDPKRVLEAMRGRHPGTDLASFSLRPGEYLTARVQLPDDDSVLRGTLLVNDEQLRIALEGDAPSDQEASEIERAFRGREKALHSIAPDLLAAQPALLSHLAQSLHLTRSGKHIDASLDLRGPPAEQVRDLGVMSSLAIAGFRRYLVAAKQAEARNVIGHLAALLRDTWAEPGGKNARRKLVSYPPVPAKMLSGVKYQSSPADWKPWAPLRFSMSEPQYYQYEIVAARDGKSADIIARGDLDGDGKTSRFTLHVTANPASHTLDLSPIEEVDPDE